MNNGFTTGLDHFEYSVENNNQKEDQARVEILVVAPYEAHIQAVDNLAATSSFHPVEIDVLANDTTHNNVTVRLPSGTSDFNAGIQVVGDRIRYTPLFRTEGKDSFTYQITRTRDFGQEVSEAKVEVVVFCCDRFELEFLCEGNKAQLDVLSDSEKSNGYELLLINDQGTSVPQITNLGVSTIEAINPVQGGDQASGPFSFLDYNPDRDFTGEEIFHYEVLEVTNLIIGDVDGDVSSASDGVSTEIGELPVSQIRRTRLIRRGQIRIRVIPCKETHFERTLKDTPRDFNILGTGESGLFVFEERSNPIPLGQALPTTNGQVQVVSVNNKNVLRYTPNDGYYGWDEFNYSFIITDPNTLTQARKYNRLQVLIDGYEKVRVASTFQDERKQLTVLSGDEVAQGYSLVVYKDRPDINALTNTPLTIITDQSGSASVIGAAAINYTPRANYLGEDGFNYAVLLNGEVYEYGRFHVLVGPNKVSVEYTTRSQAIDIEVVNVAEMLEVANPTSRRGADLRIVSDDSGRALIRYAPTDDIIGQDTFDYVVNINGEKIHGTVYVIVEDNVKVDVFTTFKNNLLTAKLFEVSATGFEILSATIPQDDSGNYPVTLENGMILKYDPEEDYVGQRRIKYRAVVNGKVQYGTIFILIVCECEDLKITGEVTDELGTVSGVVVEEVGNEDQNTTTDEAGQYMMEADSSGELRFKKDDTHKQKVEAINGRILVNATLERKLATINGSVTVEGTDGDPINNFTIAYRKSGEISYFFADGSNNTYEIDAFVESALIFTAPGYSEKRLTVPIAETAVIDVELAPKPLNITGTVTDKLGNPLVGVQVTTEGMSVETGRDGSYELEGVFIGAKIEYSTRFYKLEERTVSPQTNESEIVINVELDEITLTVFCAAKDKLSGKFLYGNNVTTNRGGSIQTKDGTEDTDKIEVIITDTLTFQSNGFVPQSFVLKILVNEGTLTFNDQNEATLIVDLESALINVTGQVRLDTADGEFVSGATVSYNDRSETSGPTGKYSIGDVPLFQPLIATHPGRPDLQDSEPTYLVPPIDDNVAFIVVSSIPVDATNSGTLDLIMRTRPDATITASSSTEITCSNDKVTLTASSSVAGASYQWEGPGGVGSNTAQIEADAATTGTYKVTVTNPATGATNTNSIEITSNIDTPDLTVPDPIINADGTVSLSAISSIVGVTFQWTDDQGAVVADPTKITKAGTYTVIATNPNNGCTVTGLVEVKAEYLFQPELTLSASGVLNCSTKSVVILTTTNIQNPSFSWSGPGSFVSTDVEPPVFLQGIYNVVVTDTVTGVTIEDSIEIIANTDTPDLTVPDPITNADGTLSLNATSSIVGVTFQWTDDQGAVVADPTKITKAGTYTVIATNPNNGCTASDKVPVKVADFPSPQVTLSVSGTLTCKTTSVRITAVTNVPEAGFAWSGPQGFVSTNPSPTVSTPGTYKVFVTNPITGAVTEKTISVSQDINKPTIFTSKTPLGQDKVRLTASAGTLTLTNSTEPIAIVDMPPRYTYRWEDGPVSGNTFDVDEPGTYKVEVEDLNNGCSNTKDIVVEARDFITPLEPTIDITVETRSGDFSSPIVPNATVKIRETGVVLGKTGSDGRVELTGVPVNVTLEAEATDYGSSPVSLVGRVDRDLVTIFMIRNSADGGGGLSF
ncbi:MAG: hypothetical protein AAGA66_09180, partial [Bacteroidota bacterium]